MAYQITKTESFSVFQRIAEFLRGHRELTALREQIKQERRQLAELDDRTLLDIGVTREQALRESERTYEDIPQQRLRFWMCCR